MSQTITATVEGDYLKPDVAIGLSQGTKVRLTVEPYDDSDLERSRAVDELDDLCEEFPVNTGGDRLTRDQLHDRR